MSKAEPSISWDGSPKRRLGDESSESMEASSGSSGGVDGEGTSGTGGAEEEVEGVDVVVGGTRAGTVGFGFVTAGGAGLGGRRN